MNMHFLKQLAFEQLGNKNSHQWKEKGNKYYHGERVASLALQLRKQLLPEDDSHDDLITVAAWFHDIMNGNDEHAAKGAMRTRELLNNCCSTKELDEICGIITVHDDRYSGRDTFSDYIKIHQDADLLDHFGTYDIWIRFLYVVPHGETIPEVLKWYEEEWPIHLDRYRKELNYDISKIIYDEKIKYVRSFIDRFRAEVNGQIWNLEEILTAAHNLEAE